VERGAERINGAKRYEVDTARSLSGKLFLGNTEVSFLLAEEETLIERKIDGSPDISPQLKGLLGNKLKVRFYSLGLKREGFLGEWKWTIKPSVSVLEAEIPFYTTNSSFPAYKNYLKPQRWDFTAYASRNFKSWDLTLGTEWQLRRLNSYHTDFYVGCGLFHMPFPMMTTCFMPSFSLRQRPLGEQAFTLAEGMSVMKIILEGLSQGLVFLIS
jgi:hypothetical protein